jgi:hypothetical protein
VYECKPLAPGRKLIVRRGKHEYLVWHHVARKKTVLDDISWATVFRTARYFLMFIIAGYALWFRTYCHAEALGEVAAETAAAVAAEAAEAAGLGLGVDAGEGGATGVGAGFDERVEAPGDAGFAAAAQAQAQAAAALKQPLMLLDTTLTQWGCAAGWAC